MRRGFLASALLLSACCGEPVDDRTPVCATCGSTGGETITVDETIDPDISAVCECQACTGAGVPSAAVCDAIHRDRDVWRRCYCAMGPEEPVMVDVTVAVEDGRVRVLSLVDSDEGNVPDDLLQCLREGLEDVRVVCRRPQSIESTHRLSFQSRDALCAGDPFDDGDAGVPPRP